jgi:hypothetical protein
LIHRWNHLPAIRLWGVAAIGKARSNGGELYSKVNYGLAKAVP